MKFKKAFYGTLYYGLIAFLALSFVGHIVGLIHFLSTFSN